MKLKNRNLILSIVNLFAYFIMVFVNFLANYLPLNGKTTGYISNKYFNLFVPAPITFNIWISIYILLLLYVLNGIYEAYKNYSDNPNFKINLYFLTSCFLNILWIFAWHYEKILLSFMIMVMLFTILYMMFLGLRKLNYRNDYQIIASKISITIYFGWISVALLANLSVLLYDMKLLGIKAIPHNGWAIIALIIGTAFSSYIILKKKVACFGIVVIWGYLGIILKRMASTVIFYDIVIVASASIILLIYLIIKIVKEDKKSI